MAPTGLAALFSLLLLRHRLAGAADDGELRALLALGAALDPTGRLLPSWGPGRDPCAGFEGVACDARGAVANVSLQGKGLAGTLSPAVSGLRALTGLYLHYNALRGGVPRELAGLAGLTDLYLGFNNLSGPVPPEIGAMASLQGEPRAASVSSDLICSFVLRSRCVRAGRDARRSFGWSAELAVLGTFSLPSVLGRTLACMWWRRGVGSLARGLLESTAD
jgi:hypothetical protein